MPADLQCRKCGATLPENTPQGLCPRCLLVAALGPTDAAPGRPTIGDEADDPEEPLRRIGRYKLLQKLGEGGCGVVYMAEQTEPVRRRVALKVIKLGMDTVQVIGRFEAERQALALMDHPNIAKVLDAGATETGRPYFVMELVKGIRITEFCDQNHLSTAERLGLFTRVCQAIQHAHQKGIIHRDIKPSNILVTLHDGVPVPKVIDFGIAKAIEQPLTEKTVFTAFGQFMGTPAYMSPEQAELSGLDIDTRSDIYALGVLLYELLTGKTPFDANELLQAGLDEMRRRIREEEPVRPSTRLSTMLDADLTQIAQRRHSEPGKLSRFIRGDLDWIVMKCLEKDRARRYETANGLAREIERFLNDEPVVACPPSAAYRFHKLVRRNRLAFSAVIAVVVALMLGLGIATWQFLDKSRAYNRAVEAEGKTRTEAAKSQQVAKFLKEMLLAAGPSVARGRDATILREILEKTSERVVKEIKDQPEVQGEIFYIIGRTYQDMGDFPRAITNDQLAVSSYRLAFTGANTNLALALAHLGRCQSFVSDVGNGKSNAALGLQMARECGDAEVLIQCLKNYARSLKAMGMGTPDEEPYVREVLELRKQLRSDPIQLADNMMDLARISTNNADSLKHLREAVAGYRQNLPPDHRTLPDALFTLGQQLASMGQFEEAERTLRETLNGFHKIHDVNHPYQSIVLRYLIYALLGQGKLKEAEAVLYEHVEAYPSNVNYYYMLVRFRMQHGSPGGATEPLPHDFQAKLEQGEFLAPWAISLLHVGANERYEEYRRRYLDVAFARGDFRGKMDIAKTLLLFGGDPQDVERSCRFAELAITNASDGDRSYHLEELTALLDLRRGRLTSAKQWASRHVAKEEEWKPRLCEGCFIKALACARLQQPRAAHAALAKGDELLTKNLPDGTEAYLFAGDEWILARYLGSEAKKEVAAIPAESAKANEPEDPTELALESEERANTFARNGQWQEAAAELAKAIKLAPTNHLLFFRRGDILGRTGRWKEAAASLAQSIETEPNNSVPYLRLAPVLLLNGDVEGYRQLCQRIVARFSGTKDVGAADTVAKACTILPRSGVDLSAVAEAAETAVTLGKESEYFPWFALCKSLAEYRQEHFAGAADWAQKSLAAEGKLLERDAAAYLVLAMAHMQLKQDGAARVALGKAGEIVDGKLPKLDSGDLGFQWVDRIIADILLREAKALIQENGTHSTDHSRAGLP